MAQAARTLGVDPHTGLIEGARQRPSPNRNARPDPADIALIVVHGISLPPGEFGGDDVDRLFTNTLDTGARPEYASLAGLRVSSHLFIRRDGELVQYVPFHERAWHAGESHWRGRDGCNDFAVGIELEGTDTVAYADAQYRRLADVVTALTRAYPRLSSERLAGHRDIAPRRKTDPGPAFDWDRLAELLRRVD